MIVEAERRAIVETLQRYCRAIDTGAWEQMVDVFLPNARVDYSGAKGPVLSGAEVGDWLRTEMARFSVLQHFISNIEIAMVGEDVRSNAYLLAVHGYKGDDGVMCFFDLGGEYRDRLVETSAGWRIAERSLEVRWVRGDTPEA